MSLTPLTNYKTLSDKRLLESFNDALGVMDANFNYTLGQVSSPVPGFSGIPENFVLAVGQSNLSKTLEYKNPNSLINLQNAFDLYTATVNKLNLGKELEFSLTGSSLPFSKFSITGRASAGSGAITHHFSLSQTSALGELNENHVVGSFAVTANVFNLNAATGYVNVNKLKIGNYAFPTTTGTKGQVLTLGDNDTLEFSNSQFSLIENADKYVLQNNKPLVVNALRFYNLNSGIDATVAAGINTEVFFKFNNNRLFTLTAPESPAAGTPSSAYIKLDGPIVLPSAESITTASAHEGSVWYDSAERRLVVMSASGPIYFKEPSANAVVNTDQAKSYNFNSSASLNLGAGNAVTPSFKVGSAGLFGSSESLNLTFNGTNAVKISKTHIEGSGEPNGGAKIVLDSQLGMGNPQAPAYTFSGANQLGLYRSGLNAVGITVQGTCVSEFIASGIDLKSKKVSNLADPSFPLDAVNKRYLESKLPTGTTANAIPVYSSISEKYIESDVKYVNGNLDVGTSLNPGGLILRNTAAGSISLKPGTNNQNLVLTLPSSVLADGLLRVNAQGQLYWADLNSLTTGLVKADGSVEISDSLTFNNSYSAGKLMISSNGAGMYANEDAVGFGAVSSRLLELSADTLSLTGSSDILNAPYIRLNNSIANYGSALGAGQPIYSFAGNKNTGIGQGALNEVAVILDGASKLTVKQAQVSVHNSKIVDVANPTLSNDAATKEYVDNRLRPVIEIAFRVTALPAGWAPDNSLILSIVDKALIYQNASAPLLFESQVDPEKTTVPADFNTNPECQCYVEQYKLTKMQKASGIRQVQFLTSGSLLINYNLVIDNIVTVRLTQ